MSRCGTEPAPVTIYPLRDFNEIDNLDDYISDFDLVSFQYSEESRLVYPSKMLLCHDGSMVILDSGSRIFKFASNGDYICRIGERGRGPGEYVSAEDICISADEKYLCVLEIGGILRYLLDDGSFVDKIETPRHNYDEFCPAPGGGYYLFAACPDYDDFDFSNPFYTIHLINDDGKGPIKELLPRKDYIMNVACITRSYDGSYLLRPLESENVLYRLEEKINPVAFIDFGKRQVPEKYIFSRGELDYSKYIESNYYKSSLYFHETANTLYFENMGPYGTPCHFLANRSTMKGVFWKDRHEDLVPPLVLSSDNNSLFIMIYNLNDYLEADDSTLNPFAKYIVNHIDECDRSALDNPVVARISFHNI